MEGGFATIGCDAIGICNTFTVHWFKHTTEGSIRVNSSEHGNKYQILITGSQVLANCHCKIGTALIINRFNHSDNGYYWCQIIISDNSHLLRSSPRGYVAVDEIMNERSLTCTFEHQISTPMCAEDVTSQETRCASDSAVYITPTITTGLYSTHIYNTNLTTAVTSIVTLPEIPLDREQNMIWVYGVMAVFLLVIIVLVLCLVLVIISKCSTQQKLSKYNADYTIVNLKDNFYIQHQVIITALANILCRKMKWAVMKWQAEL
jgi:hypothetical protein